MVGDFRELDKLIADLNAVPRNLERLVRVAMQKTAADIKADAQAFAPVDTGNLRASISYETHITADAVTAEIGPTAEYGIYVEYGTEHMAPQAYLGPAFDRRSPALDQALGQIVDGLLG